MILKVTRLSRRKKEWVTFYVFPNTYSFRLAYRILGNPHNGANIKRAKIEQVFDINEIGNKEPRFYDIKTKLLLKRTVPV